MKAKKSLYILIPLVILIWGYIAWQIIDKSKGTGKAEHVFKIADSEKNMDEKATYKIKLNYRDPFLRNKVLYTNAAKTERKTPFKSIQIKNISSYSEKPELAYHGFILFENKKTALIEYSGKNLLLNENDDSGDFRIRDIFSDSIIIVYHDKKYCYDKSK